MAFGNIVLKECIDMGFDPLSLAALSATATAGAGSAAAVAAPVATAATTAAAVGADALATTSLLAAPSAVAGLTAAVPQLGTAALIGAGNAVAIATPTVAEAAIKTALTGPLPAHPAGIGPALQAGQLYSAESGALPAHAATTSSTLGKLLAPTLLSGGISALTAPKVPKAPSMPKSATPFNSGAKSFFGPNEGSFGGTFLTGNSRSPQIAGGKKTLLGA